jgi:membrane-bound serine protease (ClpP class)
VDPTIAYLLLTIGILALIAEFNNPGAILPGVTGVICLLLALISFETLPLNWGGVALILVSVGLFILDIKAPTHGVLTAGGIVSFVLGSLILFSPLTPQPFSMPQGGLSVPWPWIAVMTVLTVGVFVFAVGAGIRAQRLRVTGGMADLVETQGVATSDLAPHGTVQVKSELWSASAVGEPIRKGEKVRVVGAEGLRLKVDRA